MIEEIGKTIYNWILTKTDGTYLGWSKATDKPPCGEPDKLGWISWGKELPEDIDMETYLYTEENNALVKQGS